MSGTPLVAGGRSGSATGPATCGRSTPPPATRSGPRTWTTTTSAGRLALDGDRVYAGTFDARVVALDRETGEPAVGDADRRPPQGGDLRLSGGGRRPGRHRGRQLRGVRPRRPADVPGPRRGARRRDGGRGWRFWLTRATPPRPPACRSGRRRPSTRSGACSTSAPGQAYGSRPHPQRRPARPRPAHRAEVWTTQFTAGDAWTITQPTGLDADVGAIPNLFRRGDAARWAWATRPAPTGPSTGIPASSLGAAADPGRDPGRRDGLGGGGRRHGLRHLQRRRPRRRHGRLDADTGDEVWPVEVGAHVTGPVTWANGVLYLSDDSGRIAAYATWTDGPGCGRTTSRSRPPAAWPWSTAPSTPAGAGGQPAPRPTPTAA